jgi:hypothetical protein
MTTEQNKSPPSDWQVSGPHQSGDGPEWHLTDGNGEFIVATNGELLARLFSAAPGIKDAGINMHAALYDLIKAYSDVQKHYGFKPEQSPQIVAAKDALKEWTSAIAKTRGQK